MSGGDGGNKIQTYEDFVRVHGILLAASGIPQSLYRLLFEKLSNESFDGGEFFQIEPVEEVEGRQRRLVFTSDFMHKESNVFLVDHAWTFRFSDAYKQLQEVPGLAERMASLMCVDIDLDANAEDACDTSEGVCASAVNASEIVEREFCKVKEGGADAVRWLELDELDIDDNVLSSLDLPSKFPNLHALSLCDNKLENVEILTTQITQLKHLRGIWLNNNPVIENGGSRVFDIIFEACPQMEIYNSRFTLNYGKWALGFCGGIYGKENPECTDQTIHPFHSLTSLDLSNRQIQNLINKDFSPAVFSCLSYLNLRGNPLDENSAHDLLKLLNGFSSLQALEVDIPGPLGDSAVEILESLPRLGNLNGVNTSKILESGKCVVDSMLQPRLAEWAAGEPVPDRVINAMWHYLMTYRLADEEKIDETSVW